MPGIWERESLQHGHWLSVPSSSRQSWNPPCSVRFSTWCCWCPRFAQGTPYLSLKSIINIFLKQNLESDSLRVEPLGYDENKSAYWYFYGTRLYREDFPKVVSWFYYSSFSITNVFQKKKIKERKKRRKEDKRRRPSSDSDYDIEETGAGVWQVVCFTEADWVELAAKLKGSTCKAERDLYRTLVEDFLPEIPRLFAQKEQQQRKRNAEYQPRTRRQSTRLGKLKQKEWHEHVPHDGDRSPLDRTQRERRER